MERRRDTGGEGVGGKVEHEHVVTRVMVEVNHTRLIPGKSQTYATVAEDKACISVNEKVATMPGATSGCLIVPWPIDKLPSSKPRATMRTGRRMPISGLRAVATYPRLTAAVRKFVVHEDQQRLPHYTLLYR